MIPNVPDAHAAYCEHCGFNFFSEFSSVIRGGAYSGGNIEPCPNCHKPVTTGDFKPSFTGEAIPSNSTLTARFKEVRATSKTLYFAMQNHRGDLLSPLWRFWVDGKQDVYIKSSASNVWKVSLHMSGQDNVSVLSDYQPHFAGIIEGRHILQAARSRPYPAHFNRILSLEIAGHDPGYVMKASREIKAKHQKAMRYVRSGVDPFQVQVVYTKGHPDAYQETYIPDSNLIGILRASRNDYITLVAANGTVLEIKDSPRLKLSMAKPLTRGHFITTDFGTILRNTFYVKQSLVAAIPDQSNYIFEP